METGAPIVSSSGIVRYVRSIAQIEGVSGEVVGWVYLAKGASDRVVFVQVRKPLDGFHLASAGLRWLSHGDVSSVVALERQWPWRDLAARTCAALTR